MDLPTADWQCRNEIATRPVLLSSWESAGGARNRFIFPADFEVDSRLFGSSLEWRPRPRTEHAAGMDGPCSGCKETGGELEGKPNDSGAACCVARSRSGRTK